MKKKNFFTICAISGSLMVFISGADNLFTHPIELIRASVIWGLGSAIIATAIYAIAEKLFPKETKKCMEILLKEE